MPFSSTRPARFSSLRYQYSAMSSLVLNSDHRGRRNENEPTGDPETLVGRIDYKAMGSRAYRETVDTGKARKKAAEKGDPSGESAPKRQKTSANTMSARDILAAADEMEGMEYIPRTAETRETYELILAAVHEAMGGEQPQDVIRDATDFVIVTLKDESLKDFDKKKEINTAIPGVNTEIFTTLVNLGKKITDFGNDKDEAERDPDQERRDTQIDDDVGVAVVFEDDEADDDERMGDGDEDENAAFEVRDESDDEDVVAAQIDGAADDASGNAAAKAADDEDQEIVIGNDTYTSSGATKVKKDSDVVPASSIDGFWLQRLVSQSYPDPHETAEKTTAAMNILSSENSTVRDVENQLMELFDYDKFGLVKILVKNQEKIVWCTKLARSDENTRMDVEVTMREKGVGWILKELASGAAAEAAAAANGGMDVDSKPAPEALTVPKANIQAGSLVQPRGTVDLESMMFSQGARLMSNKKCRLPEGSYKKSKKSYEEIHVPPPKKGEPKQGELVPISDLPEWSRVAFKGATSLNRVQSKLYPVAFGEDDPLLLCAPTGAGKVSRRIARVSSCACPLISCCICHRRPTLPC